MEATTFTGMLTPLGFLWSVLTLALAFICLAVILGMEKDFSVKGGLILKVVLTIWATVSLIGGIALFRAADTYHSFYPWSSFPTSLKVITTIGSVTALIVLCYALTILIRAVRSYGKDKLAEKRQVSQNTVSAARPRPSWKEPLNDRVVEKRRQADRLRASYKKSKA